MGKKLEEYIKFYDGLLFEVADFKKLNFNLRRTIATQYNENSKYLNSTITLSGENESNYNFQKLMFNKKHQKSMEKLTVDNLEDVQKFIKSMDNDNLIIFITEILAYVRLGVMLIDFDGQTDKDLNMNEEELLVNNPDRIGEILTIIKKRETKWNEIIKEITSYGVEFVKKQFENNEYIHINDNKLQISTKIFADSGYGSLDDFSEKYINLEDFLSKNIVSESVNIRSKEVWSTIYHGNIEILDKLIVELEKIFIYSVLDILEITNYAFWKTNRKELYEEYFSIFTSIKKIKEDKQTEIFS